MQPNEITTEAVKASPSVTVLGLNLAGVHLDTWIQVVTLVFVLFQLYFLLRDKWYRDRKRRKNG